MLHVVLLAAAAQLETVNIYAEPSQRTFMALMTCSGGCSGHGVCEVSTGMCDCYADDLTGYWDSATQCATCLEGYAGPSCLKECPGGSCNKCNGHGTCSEGLTGNGSCKCDPQWRGAACDTCQDDYYGYDCASPCPGHPNTCGNKGTCDSGITGTGTCTCKQDPVEGYWGPSSGCTDCDDAHYGPQCNIQCVSKGVCSGHGSCNSGMAGDGLCVCDIGWTSSQCNIRCPGSNATHECGGSGTCLANGTCACLNVNFRLPDCTQCVDGKTGPLCTDNCPANAIGQSCGGNGVCNRDGTCTCNVGYANSQTPGDAPACQSMCPGGVLSPCSGNGICNQDLATCECFDDSVRGHWDGALCDTCKAGWSGRPNATSIGCRLACPGGANECNGHGKCLEGMCFCDSAWCGIACQTKAVGKNCHNCPVGTWSHDGDPNECSQQCPGVGTPSGKCSGHGECIETKRVPLGNDNNCVCESGYGTADCSQQCPGGATPCGGAGRGVCNPDTLKCICFAGFAGDDCSTACPRDMYGHPCGGNTCFDASWVETNGQPKPPNVLGGCDCQSACQVTTPIGCALGFVGAACSSPCDCTVNINGTAEAHGYCDASGACVCDKNWAGSHCEKCASGMFGTKCDKVCGMTTSGGFVTGTTAGLLCECAENWYGDDCTKACNGVDMKTGLPGPSGVCSNKGTCNWGSANTGDCACEEYYYKDDCSVRCDAAKCGHLSHWTCSADGDCVCVDDATGHWANLSTGCVECKGMWWGANCDVPCDCSTHGTCDRSTGTPCKCFADAINGFWAGENCEKCDTGYVGLQCNGKHISITRIGTVDPRVQMATPKALYVDEGEGYIYTGGEPLLVISMRVAKGASSSFPVLTSTSRNQLGCRGTTGSVTFVTKYTDTIYMTVDACDGMRVYSMPSVQQGAIDFSIAKLLTTDKTVNGAKTVIARAARDSTVVAVVLHTGGGPVLRVVDVATAKVRCQSLALMPLLRNATGVAVDYNGGMVYVSGTGVDGGWAVVAVDGTCGSSVMSKAKGLEIGVPCDAVDCEVLSRVVYFKGHLVGIVEGARGTGLTVINPSSKTTRTVAVTATRVSGTALAVDDVTEVCYATTEDMGEPSVVTKYSFIDVPGGLAPVMYGELDLTFSITSNGFAAERIAMLHPAEGWRVLYGLTTGSNQVRLIPFLLYEVHAIYPPVSDTKGDTVMDIRGRGFAAVDLIGPAAAGPYPVVCQVAEASFQPATVVNGTLMQCATNSVDATAETSCKGDSLEVSLYGTTNALTDNSVRVIRVHSVSINESQPEKGFYTGKDIFGSDVVVTITGYGFQQPGACPDCLSCKFYDNATEYVSQGPSMVTFINPYSITCKQPRTLGPSTDPSFLDVALDGQVYSGKPVPYVIVGSPSGLTITTTATVLKAALSMAVPDITVSVVDGKGHTVQDYDGAHRTVSIGISEYISDEGTPVDTSKGAKTVVNMSGGGCTTTNGTCVITGITIGYPPTGDLTLKITTTDTGTKSKEGQVLSGWEATVKYRITEGDPVQLVVQDQPSVEIPEGYTQLPTQPVVVLADEIGNVVRKYPNVLTTVAQLTSVPANYSREQIYPSKQASGSDQNGVMAFEGIAIKALYGVTYRLNFSVPERPELGYVLSREMRKVPCDSSMYSVDWTEYCAPCPSPGGVCNGTSVVLAQEGYWREHSNTSTFYKCKSAQVCQGGAAGDELCATGTTGPICSVCMPGYGKSPSGCSKCGSHSANLATILIAFLVVLCVLTVWIIMTLGKTVDSAYTIIGRILVTHLQAGSVGNFSENWDQFLKDVFSMQSQGSTLSIDGFSALDCIMRDANGDYYTYFTGYMMLPLMPLVIAALVYGVIVARRTANPALLQNKEVEDEIRSLSRTPTNPDEDKLNGEEERVLNNIYAYKFSQVLLTTMSVCLFVLYPTLINQAAVMLRCDSYSETRHEIQPSGDWGYTKLSAKSYLSIDHSIDCSTSKYGAYYLFATLGLIGYGLGIPIVFVVSVRKVWKKRGYKRTYVMFIFLMGGFTKKSWFWQAVIMLRKLALGIIAVFIQGKGDDDPSNDPLQSYVAIWVITACLVLQLYTKPYQHDEKAPYNNLEALSLGVIALTLNLGLLYNWQDMPKALRNALTVILATITFATLAVFLYYIVVSLIPVVHEALDKDGDGKFTMFDLKLWLRMASITEEQIKINKERVKSMKVKPSRHSMASFGSYDGDPLIHEGEGDELSPLEVVSETNPAYDSSALTGKNPLYNRYFPPELASPTSPTSPFSLDGIRPVRRKTSVVTDNIALALLPENQSTVWDDVSPKSRSPRPAGSPMPASPLS
eukprot:TRINITY_DN24636_c0_g1_i1.p1 TRINITY_DN24636_c0_g1~~TRINITY_DN24636_c0_g1_i1.p1  ORF type:complete len:2314 (+),score=527.02 TRINITY_DN24636_c0_g1_i1:266-7207(+)